MTTLEDLEQHANDHHIQLLTYPLPCAGLYYARPGERYTITLSTALKTTCERCSVLAEELGHHHTTPINLFTAPPKLQIGYERRAAEWAACALLPPAKLVRAWRAGVREPWELAEYCDCTEQFLRSSMELYAAHYDHGLTCDGCLITFDLLHIQEVS